MENATMFGSSTLANNFISFSGVEFSFFFLFLEADGAHAIDLFGVLVYMDFI